MKFLTPETTAQMKRSLNMLSGYIDVAASLPNAEMSKAIITKLEDRKENIKSQYAEIENEDGSTLVKHPAIGFITIEEKLCEEPVRLFASKVKSLSTSRVRVFRCDALVSQQGNVDYVNRVLLLDVEMSQMEFANLLANPGRGVYAATIRQNAETEIEFKGDLNTLRSKMMYDAAQEMTDGLSQWVDELVNAADKAKEKGGVMSKSARMEASKTAHVLGEWTESNPAYYAQRLAEFTDKTTTDIKLEVMSANKIKESM